MTFEAAFQDFLTLCVGDGSASPRTLKAYREGFQAYVAWAASAGVQPAAADRRALELYRSHLYERGYKKATVRARLGAVRILYRSLVRAGLRQDDPSAGLKAAKDRTAAADSVLGKALSPEEAARFLEYVDALPQSLSRDRAMLLVMVYHGLRAEEVTRLRVQDFAPERGLLTIHGKGAKERTSVLTRATQAALSDHLHASGAIEAAAPLFSMQRDTAAPGLNLSTGTTPRPLSVRAVERIVDRHLAACDLKTKGRSAHALRHTFGVLATLGGAKSEALAAAMGHSSIMTTHTYTKAAARYQDNPAEALGLALETVRAARPKKSPEGLDPQGSHSDLLA
jgi:integrase/recombinase XerC